MIAAMPSQAPKKQEVLGTAQMFGLVGEIGFLIALPAALFGFGGAYVDDLWGTSPLMMILGLALALFGSSLAVWHRIKPFLSA